MSELTPEQERDLAIKMLADWVACVDVTGTGWDDWDEAYKDAAYRPCSIRERLDAAISESKETMQRWQR